MTLLATGAAPCPLASTAAPRSSAQVWLQTNWTSLVIGMALLGGLGLRLAAARGELWLDELWSLDLVSHITSPDQVFWAIPHDNNHFLNSLWMYVLGQHASPVAYRLPSVLFSSLAILAAARIGRRVNPAAGAAAAIITACSYPFVDYGSEARGYGGLMLAILLAVDLTQTSLNRLDASPARSGSPPPASSSPENPQASESVNGSKLRAYRLRLAAVIAFGVCAHLTMFVEAAVLGLATVARLTPRMPVRRALDTAVALFRPSILALVPIVAVVVLGIGLQGRFVIGGFLPFTPERFVRGFGGLLGVLLGLPSSVPDWASLVVTPAIVVGATLARLLDRRWWALAAVAMAAWPLAIYLARVPNTEYARYFLTAGLLLPIFLAEIAGRLWSRGGLARAAGLVLVAGVCAGQAPHLAELIGNHRGAPAAAVALMGRDGPTTFRARNRAITDPVIDVYATELGLDVKPADAGDRCHHPAAWVVYDADYGEAVPDAPELAGGGCVARYAKVQAFPGALWSGRSWTLYRRIASPAVSP